jgi:hypothetical protein
LLPSGRGGFIENTTALDFLRTKHDMAASIPKPFRTNPERFSEKAV